MGRLAERLARRRSPLYQHAKELIRLALDAMAEDYETSDEGDLEHALEEALDGLEAGAFDTLLDMAVDEARLHEDGEEAVDHLLATAREVAEVTESDDGESSRLFGLPVAVQAELDDPFLVMTEDQCDQVAQALQEAELLDEDAAVNLLPVLLPAAFADSLEMAQVYQISRTLAHDGPAEAEALVKEWLATWEAPERLRTDAAVLVLMGEVTFEDANPFVAAQLYELEHDELPDQADDRYESTHHALHVDMHAHLASVAAAMAHILQVEKVELTAPADRWSAVNDVAFRIERDDKARRDLQELADKHTSGDLSALTVYQPGMENGVLAFPVHRKADNAHVGMLTWKDATEEPWTAALHRLFQLLGSVGVMPSFQLDDEELEAPEGPLH